MTKDYAKNIENALKSCLPSTDCREKKLIDAMAYSLEAGGKRVRPYLVFSFNSLCGGSEESATAFACACVNPFCFLYFLILLFFLYRIKTTQ